MTVEEINIDAMMRFDKAELYAAAASQEGLERFVIRTLTSIAVGTALKALLCEECFGTGLRGGWHVACSRGCKGII